ncbi:MAG: M48 family metalloprotease [Zetaproteobacteria bacterium]|nr:M48 family metalloprotease [Zetaproteobacteria bacterium]
MINRSRIKPILTAVMIATALSACATNPVSKKSEFVLMSEKEELALGKQASQQMSQQLRILPETDPLARYVNRIGQKIAKFTDRPELFYRFYVVDDATINAFALPGGYIFIHRGLLMRFNSESELAAVIGHELGHVTARHAVARYTQVRGYQTAMTAASIFLPIPPVAGNMSDVLASAVISGFGREQELQSDILSLKYIGAAGYDVQSTVHLLETLQRIEKISEKEKKDAGEKVEAYHGAFASHPETKKRIEEAIKKASAMQNDQAHKLIGHDEFLLQIKGYPLNDSPADGAVVGNRFLHPDLQFQLEFPDNQSWMIKNTPQSLTARVRKEEVYFDLQTLELQKKQSLTEILHGLYPERHIHDVKTGTHDRFEYIHAHVDASAPHVSKAAIDVTIWLDGPRAFIGRTWCKRDEIDKWRPQFHQIHESFGDYDADKEGGIPMVTLYNWKRGDSWEALAAQHNHALGKFTADRLAALNGMDLEQTPAEGTLIKVLQ